MLASVGFHRSGCGLVGPLCVFCDVCSFWRLHIVALVSMDLASEPILILLVSRWSVLGFLEFIVSVTGHFLGQSYGFRRACCCLCVCFLWRLRFSCRRRWSPMSARLLFPPLAPETALRFSGGSGHSDNVACSRRPCASPILLLSLACVLSSPVSQWR
jgi:hypothetical protein